MYGGSPESIVGGRMSEAEQALYNRALGFAEGGEPRSPVTQPWGRALGGLLSGQPTTQITPETTEQFFEQAIRAPAMADYERTQSDIKEQQAAQGTLYGSGRNEAQARAAERFETGLMGQRANLMYQDEQARRGLAESAAGRQLSALSPALSGMQYHEAAPYREMGALQQFGGAPRDIWSQQLGAQMQMIPQQYQMGMEQYRMPQEIAGSMMGMGALPRQLQQQYMTAAQQEWMRTQPQYNPMMSAALSYLGTPMLTSVGVPQPSPFEMFSSGAGMLGGALMGMGF